MERTGEEYWIFTKWLSTSRCSLEICLPSTNQASHPFLDSSFSLPLSQILRVIKMTKIKTLTPTHLFFKLLLNIYLIFIIVFSAFTSLDGFVTIATTSSSHNTFFKKPHSGNSALFQLVLFTLTLWIKNDWTYSVVAPIMILCSSVAPSNKSAFHISLSGPQNFC